MTALARRRTRTAADSPTANALLRGGVLLDTGVLVALYARDDPRHLAVAQWMASFRGELHTVEPVLTEAAYFLPVRLRSALAKLAEGGAVRLHYPDPAGYARIADLLRKYADLDPDWADISLVWLAETTGIHRIATLDVAGFSVYRIHGRRRFELALLRLDAGHAHPRQAQPRRSLSHRAARAHAGAAAAPGARASGRRGEPQPACSRRTPATH